MMHVVSDGQCTLTLRDNIYIQVERPGKDLVGIISIYGLIDTKDCCSGATLASLTKYEN